LEHNGVIDAYGIMGLSADNAHIWNLCVRPESQRSGLGRQMLVHLLTLARHYQAGTARLEVHASNHAAIGLYTGMGFHTISVRKAYYRTVQGDDDALIMTRLL
jgi:ribosomal-protein-alanine N-acetyltransferase